MKVTVGIPTKNRYESLDKTLLSIALQTVSPYEVIIVDDSDNPINLTTIPHYEYIFRLFDEKGIKWQVKFGKRMGQHHSHQMVQDMAETDWIFRIDDDCVAEPDVLRRLIGVIKSSLGSNIGAVAPSVTMPNPQPLPPGMRNTIKNLNSPNIQWFKGEGTHPAEHLYSCFLYRKGIAMYDLTLSSVAHREETIFSHSIKRTGHTLYVNMDAQVHHFQGREGGIRTFRDPALWEHDEKIFKAYLSLWNVTPEDNKMVVLDCGIGDHWAFKNILPEMKKKYGKITIAACFPDVFWDEPDLTIISIADAKNIYGDITPFQVYKLLWDTKEKIHLIEGFRRMYL